MSERDTYALVAAMVKECETFSAELSKDRISANEYYDGKMTDVPNDTGRSAAVSRDIQAVVQKVLPAMTRIFLASDEIVEFQPMQAEDDEGAKQASDYMNYHVFPECNGHMVVSDAIHDTLRLRNAVVGWWYEEKTDVKVSKHSGLSTESFGKLIESNDVEVLEHTERQEEVDDPELGVTVQTVHDAKLRRKIVSRKPVIECLPLEEFLIHPDAVNEDTAPIIGRKYKLRRTDLVAMGYDKDVVWSLSVGDGKDASNSATETNSRRDTPSDARSEIAMELQEIDYYVVYVRIDMDGDGIAELRRMCFGGNISNASMLDDEEWDEIPFAIIAAKHKPHQWEGVSLADDLKDIQRIKTVLLRNTLDNLYWQNNLQMAVQSDKIENMDAVNNPAFGQAVHVKPGVDIREAIQPIPVPFVAKESFGMMEYLDSEKEDRTGVSDASSGLAPSALQNMTAKASAMIEQQGIGQTELIARTLAVGFKRMFRGLLRLVIKNQDKPRAIRLRNKWVEYDPRSWNADMDCVVNTGLGAGTRERDVQIMTQVLGVQKEILANFGPNNPLVSIKELSNSLARFTDAAGLKNTRLYFKQPTDEELEQSAAIPPAPDPEIVKIEKQIEAQVHMKEMDMRAAEFKEQVQSMAAVEEAAARAEIEEKGKEADRTLKKYEIDQKNALEWAKLNQSATIEATRMDRDDARHMSSLGLERGDDGKTYDIANRRLEEIAVSLIENANKPKRSRVVTPDGEEFFMETVN